MGPEEILTEAMRLLESGEAIYRDTLLRVGNLLHEYILVFLKAGDGLSEKERGAKGITRAIAVHNLVEALGKKGRFGIYPVIAAAMTVQLLADDGNVGDLGHRSILHFARFVERKSVRTLGTDGRTTKEGVGVSDMEQWQIKPAFGDLAPTLFRKAVRESWEQKKARVECVTLLRDRTPDHRRIGGKTRRPLPQNEVDRMHASARLASPGDVAEMCMGFVGAADDPYAVALRLRVMIETYLGKKPKLNLA